MTAQILDIGNSGLDEAARWLRGGELVAFPTETVYGLGADATNPDAISAVFEAKGRPSDNPLIVHLGEAAEADEVAHVTALGGDLLRAFAPGPLTVVLPARSGLPPAVTAGLGTVAVRVPSASASRNFVTTRSTWSG